MGVPGRNNLVVTIEWGLCGTLERMELFLIVRYKICLIVASCSGEWNCFII